MVLLDGDARTRPRSHATLRVHFGIVRPFIKCWAATRGHLREITPGDVDTVLEPLRGHRRYNAIIALRSLFRFAKRRGLTFADPTRHLSGGRGAGRTVLPMTAEEIRVVEQAAVTPAQRLTIALAAVHAARPKAIRELTLDDIDLPSRRITLAGHRQRLGELTHNALLAWLGYRRATREGLADDDLGLAGGVDVCGVDERDASVECAVDDPDAFVVVLGAPLAEHHGAQA